MVVINSDLPAFQIMRLQMAKKVKNCLGHKNTCVLSRYAIIKRDIIMIARKNKMSDLIIFIHF